MIGISRISRLRWTRSAEAPCTSAALSQALAMAEKTRPKNESTQPKHSVEGTPPRTGPDSLATRTIDHPAGSSAGKRYSAIAERLGERQRRSAEAGRVASKFC